ncbi:hypothetical protein [Mesorhizobium sp. M1409]
MTAQTAGCLAAVGGFSRGHYDGFDVMAARISISDDVVSKLFN